MIDLNNTVSIHKIADWVELSIIYNSATLSRAKLIALLNENGYEDDEDYRGDEIFDSVLAELQRRIELYGDKAPFEIRGTLVEPKQNWVNCPEYAMCLIFSYLGAENSHEGTKLFERLSNEALKSYLGGETITLGFPGNLPLNAQLDQIAELCCEDRGNRNPDPNDKDRGVDVIGWKPHKDKRNSQLIVLMQCAAGKNWKRKKEIPLTAWAQYIHWNYTTTIQSLSIAEVVELKKWQKVVDEYGLIFDRARIYRYIYDNDFSIDNDLRNEIKNWCREKLN